MIAGAIIGLGMLLGGISTAVLMTKQHGFRPPNLSDQITNYVMITFVGVVIPLAGIGMLVWMKRLFSHRVILHINGFVFVYASTAETVLWCDLEKISEVFTEERLQVLHFPGAVIENTDRSFLLHRRDGKEFRFTVNTIDDISLLGRCLEEACERFSIKWERIDN